MKLSKGWSAYIFPKNNLRYLLTANGLTNMLTDGTMRVEETNKWIMNCM